MSSKNSRIRNSLIGVAGVVAVGLALSAPTTGADFSASDTGTVSIQSGNLTVELSDSNSVGTFDLDFDNLAPGETKVDQFTVKNTGSIPADVKLGGISLGANNFAGLTGPQLNMLKAGIDGYQASASVPSLTGVMQLGELNPGQSRTYTVRVGLDQVAGNEWQNRHVAAGLTVTLAQ